MVLLVGLEYLLEAAAEECLRGESGELCVCVCVCVCVMKRGHGWGEY